MDRVTPLRARERVRVPRRRDRRRPGTQGYYKIGGGELLALAVLGTLAQLALDVLLRPVVAHDAIDARLAGRIGCALRHREVRVADDLLRPRAGHGVLLAELRAPPQVFAHLRLGPAVVDDPAAVGAHPRRVGIAAEDV